MRLLLRHVALAALACNGMFGCATFHKGPMPGEPKDASFAQVGNTRMRYTDRGKGPAVVMIHGFASSLETWDLVAPQLARNHRVITVDLRGFGWTDRPEQADYSPIGQARLVQDLLDQRGVEKSAIVAHSWGTSVALVMALQQPHRFTRLALYDAWAYDEQLPTTFIWARAEVVGEILFDWYYKERGEDKLAQAFYDKRFISQQLVDDVERALDRPGTTAAALAAVRGMRYDLWEQRYKTIQQPVLLLWGREDSTSTLAIGERLHRDLPNSRMIVYPRCGHLPMLEAAAASNADLISFLDEDLK